jgi:hypothetical protein
MGYNTKFYRVFETIQKTIEASGNNQESPCPETVASENLKLVHHKKSRYKNVYFSLQGF